MTSPSPIQRYLVVQGMTEAQLNATLKDAIAEATKRINKLAGKDGIGAVVRAGQLRQVRTSLRTMQAQLWGEVGQKVSAGRARAAVAAVEAEQAASRALWASLAGPIPQLEAALRAQAEATVETLAARAKNAIPLSKQVFKTASYSGGWVDRAVNRSILQGDSWKEMADSVAELINPNVPGGVSFAAKRLGRSELNNAFHRQQIEEADQSPFVTGVKWNLSRSHPHADACDQYAKESHTPDGGPGVFATGNVPSKPHPQCFCFLTTIHVSEEEFVEDFFKGNYNKYIDTTSYRYGQGVC